MSPRWPWEHRHWHHRGHHSRHRKAQLHFGIEKVQPDIIVTATGLKLRSGGGISISIDNESYQIKDHYVWEGLMFEDLPKLAFSFGYFDLTWTLGVDTSARLICRIMAQMKKEDVEVVVPRLTEDEKRGMKDVNFMPLKSTYVRRALKDLPKLGDRRQLNGRASYLWEMVAVKYGDIRTGLEWT